MTVWKSFTDTLAHPVTVGEGSDSVTYDSVTLREPDLDALERLEDSGVFSRDEGAAMSMKQIRVCLSALSGLPPEAIGKMNHGDIRMLAVHLGPLLNPSEEEDGQPGKSRPKSR